MILQKLFIIGLWVWCNFCLLTSNCEGADGTEEGTKEIGISLSVVDDNSSSFPNNYGESYRQGINLSTDLRLCGKFYDFCPQLKFSRDNATADLKWGYLSYSKWNTTIQAGRIPHWWGPGHSGAWLLTTNAQTFDQIKLTNRQAVLLPWLGSSKLEFILGELSKQTINYSNNSVPTTKTEKPGLVGLRFDCSPNKYIKLGAGETCMISGRERLKIQDYFQALFPGGDTTIQEMTNGPITNRIASIDTTFRIPINHQCLKGAEIYWEYGGEDCNPTRGGFQFLSAPANLFGIYLDTGIADMRIEYAEDEDDCVIWYTHGNFTKGYRHKDKILGHHMNGKSWYFSASCPIPLKQTGFLEAEMVNNKIAGIDLGCLDTWRLRIRPDDGVSVDYKVGW